MPEIRPQGCIKFDEDHEDHKFNVWCYRGVICHVPFSQCSVAARLLWFYLNVQCGCQRMVVDDLDVLKQLFPNDELDLETLIHELIQAGLVKRTTIGERLFPIEGWENAEPHKLRKLLDKFGFEDPNETVLYIYFP